MSDEPKWFAPKRYGYGASLPISWQGWALTIGYVLICVACAILFARKPFVLVGLIVPLTVVFVVITSRTTKGGWRWRWGDEE